MAVDDFSLQVNSKLILKHNQAQFSRLVVNEQYLNWLFRQFETVFFSKKLAVWVRQSIDRDDLIFCADDKLRVW